MYVHLFNFYGSQPTIIGNCSSVKKMLCIFNKVFWELSSNSETQCSHNCHREEIRIQIRRKNCWFVWVYHSLMGISSTSKSLRFNGNVTGLTMHLISRWLYGISKCLPLSGWPPLSCWLRNFDCITLPCNYELRNGASCSNLLNGRRQTSIFSPTICSMVVVEYDNTDQTYESGMWVKKTYAKCCGCLKCYIYAEYYCYMN